MPDTTRDLLARFPKMELHIHLEGSLAPQTAIDLARRNGVLLPAYKSVEDFYRFDSFDDFLRLFSAISASIKHADDFHRITYEMLAKASADGARYVEFFFSPHAHLAVDVPYSVQIEGMCAGIKDAGKDFSILARIVPGINRELGVPAALEMLDLILGCRPEEVIGIGLDHREVPFPPEPYAGLFAAAREAGLHVTSHAGETGPASSIAGSLSALKSERIDHGYSVVTDAELMRRCKDEGVLFTVCPSTAAAMSPWTDLSAPDHAIRQMREYGLKLCINSDDPPMLYTDLANEYVKCVEQLKFSIDDIVSSIQAAIDGAWIDESLKKRWSREWMEEIRLLRSTHEHQ